jgi:hypothetical protein
MSTLKTGRNLARGKLRTWAALCSLGFVLLFTQTGQGAATTDPFTFFPNIVLTGNCVVGGVDLAPGSGGEALSPERSQWQLRRRRQLRRWRPPFVRRSATRRQSPLK